MRLLHSQVVSVQVVGNTAAEGKEVWGQPNIQGSVGQAGLDHHQEGFIYGFERPHMVAYKGHMV